MLKSATHTTNMERMLLKERGRDLRVPAWTTFFLRCSAVAVAADSSHKDLRKASQSNTHLRCLLRSFTMERLPKLK